MRESKAPHPDPSVLPASHQSFGLGPVGVALAACLVSAPSDAGTLVRASSFSYTPESGLLSKEVVEPENAGGCLVTEHRYDRRGNRTNTTIRNCNGLPGETARATGTAVFAARASDDSYSPGRAVINGTTYGWQTGQFRTSALNAMRHRETRTYDPRFGAVMEHADPNGQAIQWSYDGFGRRIHEIRPDGTRTRWDYLYCAGVHGGTASCPMADGGTGAYVVVETPLASDGVTPGGPVSKTYYDDLNREVRRETQGFDGDGSAPAIYRDTRYDSMGRPYMTSRPYFAGQTAFWTILTYDALGRPVEVAEPDGATTMTAFSGLTVAVIDPKGQMRTTVKDSQGRVVSIRDAANNLLTFAYDPFGNLVRTTDPLGNVTTAAYDLRGRKTRMADPDMGTWSYAYNALGEVVRRTDPKGQVTTLAYDKIGRLVQRAEADLVSTWYNDVRKGGGTCPGGIGKPCQAETSTGYRRTHAYDVLGRASAVTTHIGAAYSNNITYDALGRVAMLAYPSGMRLKYVYTPLGYLKEVRNYATDSLYWRADAVDAEGRIIAETYGNGIRTERFFDPRGGRLMLITAGPGNSVQSLAYGYDRAGNLVNRRDYNQGLDEIFDYDPLNRLTSSTSGSMRIGILRKTYSYDAIGNLTYRSDMGTYLYPPSGGGSVRPHAVSRLELGSGGFRIYAYDTNGNMVTEKRFAGPGRLGGSRGQTYSSFNMPLTISTNGRKSEFAYGPEHQRIRQISSAASGTTIYVNPGNSGELLYEMDERPDGSIEQRNFISAGGQIVAMLKQVSTSRGATVQVRYLHRDNLGSTTAVTDASGAVIERLAYEPFGKRRLPVGADDPGGSLMAATTDRGFTNHEHMDELGLIHMNGRTYDPSIGRFMSADSHVQEPEDLQSYNRYSYVLNNPLLYTDPSGYFSFRRLFKTAAIAVAAYFTAGYASSLYAATAATSTAAATGAAAGTAAYGAAYASAYATAVSSTTAAVIGGAAGGFTAGFLGSGGSVEAGFRAAAGGAIGGALVGSGAFGRMMGGGVSGYLQTGQLGGFARGFAAGAIPQDLWFGDVFRKNAFGNVGVGIARDGIRGSFAAGSLRGFGDGMIYGQSTNLAGHAIGYLLSGFAGPHFNDGVFVYGRDYLSGQGAITIGNVISGSQAVLSNRLPGGSHSVIEHELAHIPQSVALGAAYIPLQGFVLGVTNFLPGGHHGRYNFLECSPVWISVPHGESCN